jgi:hypothetical protein
LASAFRVEAMAVVVNLALRSLLAMGLKHQIEELWPTPSTVVPAFPADPLTVTSLRLETGKTGIAYRSSLLQRLTTTCPPADLDGLKTALMNAWPGQVRSASPALSAADLATALWSWIRLEAHPSGQLRLALATSGVVLWLWHWNRQSAESLCAALPRQVLAVNTDKFPSSTAQRLQLHPAVLIQYVYARCYQLRLSHSRETIGSEETTSSTALDTKPPPGENLSFSPADGAALQPLIHLVDQLEVTALNPEGLWKLGLGLAEATDLWLEEWPTTRAASPAQWMILRGIERALFYFMKHKFDHPLPITL